MPTVLLGATLGSLRCCGLQPFAGVRRLSAHGPLSRVGRNFCESCGFVLSYVWEADKGQAWSRDRALVGSV